MAEAIAALAFAGSIVQFLELGAKFAMKADQIVKTGSSSLSDLQELRHITHYLQPLLQQLNADDSSNQASIQTPSQLRLANLSKECSEVVRELLQTLDRAGVNNPGGRRDAVVTSFRLTWNHSKIEKLHQHIDKLRGQLAVELLVSIREHSSRSQKTQEKILKQLKADSRYSPPKPRNPGHQDFVEHVGDAPGSIILQYIRSTLESGITNEQMTKTEDDIHQLLFQQGAYVDDNNNAGQNHPRIEMIRSRRKNIEAYIISSLRYSQIADREASIAEAYKKTFRWMFKDSPPDRKDTKFREWLGSSDGLYWITGKAGCGKSTLMKYISNFHGRSEGSIKCEEHLHKWSGGSDRLMVASFYFWASGSSIEASQRGLFQSLLFQILQAHPDLLPTIAPKTWEAWSSFGLRVSIETEKTLDEILFSAIRELVEQRDKKVCLFVDGLDEYDGDHEKLIATFRSFLLLPNVKMCVSSRPWAVFEDSFSTEPSLMLQELTYPDIEYFVNSQFSENPGFARLKLREPEYAKTLITNITDKALGVFLWVKLAVTSLLTGLTNDDRMSDLQRRLNLLPPDLEKLYDAILNDLDSFYLGHASQYFQILEASNGSPDILVYSFSDEESLDFALNLPIRALTGEEIQHRTNTVKRRLNSRCKGLLEVGPQEKIRYLHRSVRDYINKSEVRLRIDGAVEKDFDCHLQLCSANLAMVKIMGDCVDHERLPYAKECLVMAAGVKRNVPRMVQILDDLNRTLRGVLSPYGLESFYKAMPQHNRRLSVPGFDLDRRNYFGMSFLAATVRYSVVNYVRARAETSCVVKDANDDPDKRRTYPLGPGSDSEKSQFNQMMQKFRFLILSKSRKISIRNEGTWPLLLDAIACEPTSLPMFQCLLELGADPNLVLSHRWATTPWIETLATMIKRTHREPNPDAVAEVWKEWVPILVLFLEHGAQRHNTAYKAAWNRALLLDASLSRIANGEHVAVALECLAKGKNDLGFEYLIGERDVATYNWKRKFKAATSRSQSSPDDNNSESDGDL